MRVNYGQLAKDAVAADLGVRQPAREASIFLPCTTTWLTNNTIRDRADGAANCLYSEPPLAGLDGNDQQLQVGSVENVKPESCPSIEGLTGIHSI